MKDEKQEEKKSEEHDAAPSFYFEVVEREVEEKKRGGDTDDDGRRAYLHIGFMVAQGMRPSLNLRIGASPDLPSFAIIRCEPAARPPAPTVNAVYETWARTDVIGAGYEAATRTVFFTKNGVRVPHVLDVASSCARWKQPMTLHAAVSFEANVASEIDCNFGEKPFCASAYDAVAQPGCRWAERWDTVKISDSEPHHRVTFKAPKHASVRTLAPVVDQARVPTVHSPNVRYFEVACARNPDD